MQEDHYVTYSRGGHLPDAGLLDYEDAEFYADKSFNILDDIDTVLFLHVNAFIHSITDTLLEDEELELPLHRNDSKAPNDERTEYATSRINFYFHQLMQIMSESQIEAIRQIHHTLNDDI